MKAKPVFFATPSNFRAWLEKNYQNATELLVGFYKKGSGMPSITWPESVDEALCYGWIDGVRRRVDGSRYTIRFTPRKAQSTWSAINIRRAQELHAAGRMSAAGLQAFARRSDERSAIYAYEQRKSARLDKSQEKLFRANRQAWDFFHRQIESYRRTAIYWVVSAKKADTRARRLAVLIECSVRGEAIPPLRRRP